MTDRDEHTAKMQRLKASVDRRIEAAQEEKGLLMVYTGAGKVREYQLVQSLRFQLLDRAGKALIPPTGLSARREYTFDDSQVLGKEQEEALLYRDMQNDLVQQLMRRLGAARRSG